MNLPNVLTVFRIILTCFFIYFLSREEAGALLAALVLFTAASVTDYLDGYLARRYNLITRFGKIMDPIADKFLILSAFFVFMHKSLILEWMFVLIFARELLVTILRLMALSQGEGLAAEGAGKLKTVLQITAVYLIILFAVLGGYCSRGWFIAAYTAIYVFMLAVVFITLWSGAVFTLNNRGKLFHVR